MALTAEQKVGCVFAFFYLPLLVVLGYILRGWALAKLWLWFIVSTFHLTPLSIAHAIGLAIVVGFLTYQYETCDCEKKKEAKGIGYMLINSTTRVVIPPLLALLVGYIVSLYL